VNWAGIDVGGRRKGFHAAIVDESRLRAGPDRHATPSDVVAWLEPFQPAVVAVDSPVAPAPDGASSRECERQLAADVCGLRYTPDEAALRSSPYYEWILHGFELYAAIAGRWRTIECFPTASWTRWSGPRGRTPRAAWTRAALDRLGLVGLPPRMNQDDRDAIAAAVTARAFDVGRTTAYGEIVVAER
jgi:predicted nuclease with RNAse H fold